MAIVLWLRTGLDRKRSTGFSAASAATTCRDRPEVGNVGGAAFRIDFRGATGEGKNIDAMAGNLRRFRNGERPLSALDVGKG